MNIPVDMERELKVNEFYNLVKLNLEEFCSYWIENMKSDESNQYPSKMMSSEWVKRFESYLFTIHHSNND